ncbi:hypothetical protein EX30DRAFT_125882 [Ascodesmis nigricans]|uniref:Uncharacterized protein n=1 Tax=Ascodesmis nigricans TaxID=341454 RepID=A0A4S2MP44_9PEZI|nr:hypothetical protein EX30DRAFT_125882 [Ascodesmis nigricans]
MWRRAITKVTAAKRSSQSLGVSWPKKRVWRESNQLPEDSGIQVFELARPPAHLWFLHSLSTALSATSSRFPTLVLQRVSGDFDEFPDNRRGIVMDDAPSINPEVDEATVGVALATATSPAPTRVLQVCPVLFSEVAWFRGSYSGNAVVDQEKSCQT